MGSLLVADDSGYQLLIMRYDEKVVRSSLLAGVPDRPSVPEGPPAYFTREFRPDEWGTRSLWILWDGDTPASAWSVDLPDYDPRRRDWHVQALGRLPAAEQVSASPEPRSLVAWTDVDTLFTSRTPGVSASAAARAPDGEITLVAYDLLLDDLSSFTRDHQPTPSGLPFALSDDGIVVALPADERFVDEPERLATLLQPLTTLGPLFELWAQHWRPDGQAARHLFPFEFDGQTWWGGSRALELNPGQGIWVGTALPQFDLQALVDHDPWRALTTTLLGVLAALALAAWASRRMSRPLADLVPQSQRIGDLDLSDLPATRSSLTEVNALGVALAGMRTHLRKYDQERDQAVLALRESEQRFRDTFEQAAVGMLLMDDSGQLLQVNDRLCRITGRSRQVLLAHTFQDLLHAEDRAEHEHDRQQVLDGGGESHRVERRLQNEGGPVVWVAVTTSLRHATQGGPATLLAVVEGVSAGKDMERKFLQARKMEAIGRLAGGVAHDFSNLLTVVLGNSELVLRDLPQPRVVELSAEMTSAERLLTRVLGADVELNTLSEGAPHFVRIDPVQFQQVLLNLAVNARDAMPDGGRVSMHVQRKRTDSRQDTEAVVSVSDDGVGLTPEVRAHAFEPFFTTKPPGAGSGLVLSTCWHRPVLAGQHPPGQRIRPRHHPDAHLARSGKRPGALGAQGDRTTDAGQRTHPAGGGRSPGASLAGSGAGWRRLCGPRRSPTPWRR